jgi:hypothetical protein
MKENGFEATINDINLYFSFFGKGNIKRRILSEHFAVGIRGVFDQNPHKGGIAFFPSGHTDYISI